MGPLPFPVRSTREPSSRSSCPWRKLRRGAGKKDEKVAGTERPKVRATYSLSKKDGRDLPTILLVEDNNDMRHFIVEQLMAHYKVVEAVNGATGLKNAMTDPPDLVITDLMMPKMDGIELCKMLKTDVHTSHIPVIMLTAKAGMDNKIEGLETGADDYLTKPFDAKELLARTKNLIEQRQKLRERYSNREILVDPKKDYRHLDRSALLGTGIGTVGGTACRF